MVVDADSVLDVRLLTDVEGTVFIERVAVFRVVANGIDVVHAEAAVAAFEPARFFAEPVEAVAVAAAIRELLTDAPRSRQSCTASNVRPCLAKDIAKPPYVAGDIVTI